MTRERERGIYKKYIVVGKQRTAPSLQLFLLLTHIFFAFLISFSFRCSTPRIKENRKHPNNEDAAINCKGRNAKESAVEELGGGNGTLGLFNYCVRSERGEVYVNLDREQGERVTSMRV